MKKIIKDVVLFLILFFAFLLVFSVNWLYETFGNLTLEEIVFNIKVPLQGANTDFYYEYLTKVLPLILGSTLGVWILLKLPIRKIETKIKKEKLKERATGLVVYKKHRLDKIYLLKLVFSIIVLSFCIRYTIQKTDLIDYAKNQLSDSRLIKDEYRDPKEIDIEFPEEKRNLIYIYLESMETTFYSKENGGAYEESLIPELEKLSLENIAFSSSDKLEGIHTLPGGTWTSGAMVSHSTGLPLKIAVGGNDYGAYESFLPGAYGIGEILEEQGYNQMLMVGSEAKFGGRSNFFKQHGNYIVYDVESAIEEEKITAANRVWWGFDDENLFKWSKEKITMLAEEGKPFNYTLLTADTHHVDGYWCNNCLKQYDEQYYNVISCSSRQVLNFIEWIQEQDFYENTTIVICGDHLSMQTGTFDKIESEGYKRKTLNIFINSPITTTNIKNRGASTLDMFPSTLASLGVNIKGNRLGLGTNLFSEEKTIIENYGLDYVKGEISKTSKFYNNKFVYSGK